MATSGPVTGGPNGMPKARTLCMYWFTARSSLQMFLMGLPNMISSQEMPYLSMVAKVTRPMSASAAAALPPCVAMRRAVKMMIVWPCSLACRARYTMGAMGRTVE